MGLSIRRPVSLQTVWLHIDRLDRSDGRVWAIQWLDAKGRQRYRAVNHVAMFTQGRTISWARTASKLQPRAVVSFNSAGVKFSRSGAVWTAVIASTGDRVSFEPARNPITIDTGLLRRLIAATSSVVDRKKRARV